MITATVVFSIIFLLSKDNTFVSGFKQEINFYGDGDNLTGSPRFQFKSGVPDPSYFSLDGITNVCTKGMWALYLAEDYEDRFLLHGSPQLDSVSCFQIDSSDGFPAASFRHLGPGETSLNSLTLYPLPGFDSQEYFTSVDADPHNPKSETKMKYLENVSSAVLTGSINWTLFEGENFTGSSFCYQAPVFKGAFFNTTEDLYSSFNLATVGSLIATCDPVLITAAIERLKQSQI